MKKTIKLSTELAKKMRPALAALTTKKRVLDAMVEAGTDLTGTSGLDYINDVVKVQAEWDGLYVEAIREAEGQGYRPDTDTEFAVSALHATASWTTADDNGA